MIVNMKFFGFFVLTAFCLQAHGFTLSTAAFNVTVAEEFNMFKYNLGNADKPGICIEIMNAIEKVDPKIKFSGQKQFLPLSRIEYELSVGKIDAFCGFLKTPEREKKLRFLNPPLYRVHQKVAVRADDDVKVKNLEDIRKLGAEGIIIVPPRTPHVEFLEHEGGLRLDTSAANVEAGFRMLLGKRGRFLYYSENVLDFYIKEKNLESQVKILPPVFKTQDIYFTTSPELAPEKVERLEKALARLKKEGKLKETYSRYFAR